MVRSSQPKGKKQAGLKRRRASEEEEATHFPQINGGNARIQVHNGHLPAAFQDLLLAAIQDMQAQQSELLEQQRELLEQQRELLERMANIEVNVARLSDRLSLGKHR